MQMKRRDPRNKYRAILEFLESNSLKANKDNRTLNNIKNFIHLDEENTNGVMQQLEKEGFVENLDKNYYEITFGGLNYLDSLRERKLRIDMNRSMIFATISMVIVSSLLALNNIFTNKDYLFLISFLLLILLGWFLISSLKHLGKIK